MILNENESIKKKKGREKSPTRFYRYIAFKAIVVW